MKTREFSISTDHEGMYNITARLREVIRESGVQSGLAVVYCPHTTAGITINENADPDVQHDLLLGLGTVIMGIYDPAEVAKVVEIPEGQEVAALIALGHPAQDPQAPARKDVDTLLRFE